MTNYIYISSRIRCLEKKLLKRESFDQLNKERTELKDLLEKYVPDKNFLKFLFLEEEFTKLKLLLKEKFKKGDWESVETKFQQRVVETWFRSTFEKIKKNPDPFLIDLYLDKLYFETLIKLAQKIPNKFVRDYLAKIIDLVNLKIFLRATKLGENFQELFIPGGKRAPKTFKNLSEEKLEELEEKFRDWLGEKSKYTPYGEEVVLYYWLLKNENLNKIRLQASALE